MSTDISPIKKTQEQLLQSHKELENMAYIASHDLQEPLRMIASFTELINKKHGRHFDENSKRYMDFTVKATMRMKILIADLLQYSKLSKEVFNAELMDSAQECYDLVETFNLMYKQKKVSIIIEGALPKIRMFSHHFVCVMQNIIGNGIKYAQPDLPPEIIISAYEHASSWEFRVKDNGIGIAKDYFDKVFIIFQRLHNNKDYEGTGIGLALCKRIINHYGGKIWLKSIEGEGATFYFTIPKRRVVAEIAVNKKIENL